MLFGKHKDKYLDKLNITDPYSRVRYAQGRDSILIEVKDALDKLRVEIDYEPKDEIDKAYQLGLKDALKIFLIYIKEAK